MRKNTGKDYELLTQQIYQQLLDHENDNYHKIKVQHDVKIVGKSGITHQVDVYWEFKMADVLYKTVIEVKDWSNKVKQEHLMAFKSKIDDIPDFPTGVFVGRSGFQSGAIDYAIAHGIKLVSIVENNSINHLVLKIHMRTPHIEKFNIIPDIQWIIQAKKNAEISDKFKLCRKAGDAILCDTLGNMKPLIDFIHESQKTAGNDESMEIKHIVYKFQEPWFLLTDDKRLSKLLLIGFEYDLYFTVSEQTNEYHLSDIADYILMDILNGTQTGVNLSYGI